MNPLDLTGPEFLVFYLAWGVGGLALAWMLRAFRLHKFGVLVDTRPWIPGYYPQESEAYAIALLRGGRKEAARLLLGRLVSAGLVAVTEEQVRRIPDPEKERSLLPLERTALHVVVPGGPPEEAQAAIERSVDPDLDALERDLERQGLLASPPERQALRNVQIFAFLVILGPGLTKLFVALARGKTNIGYLLLLLVAYSLAGLLLLKPPRLSSAGKLYLEWLYESHRGLTPLTVNDGGSLAAAGIFGLVALPGLTGPADRRRKDEGDGGAFGGDSGSSDGGGGDGGGGDGGGGGCGGGGCGGCGGGS